MELPADDDPTAPAPPPDPLPEVVDPTAVSEPTPQMRQLDEATAAERDEVRRLVEAGATSPDDLRALAAKIKEQREREDAVWREEVRPSLKKAKKRAFLFTDLRTEPDEGRSAERRFLIVSGLAVFLVLVVLALSSTPTVLILLLLVGLLVYAYISGRSAGDGGAQAPDAPPPEEPDEPDA